MPLVMEVSLLGVYLRVLQLRVSGIVPPLPRVHGNSGTANEHVAVSNYNSRSLTLNFCIIHTDSFSQ